LEGDFWNKKIQSASSEELKQLQLKLLKQQLRRVYRSSKFYRRKFREAKVDPSQIKSLADICKVPFTSRKELEEYPWDVLAVPSSELAAVRMTTGTTGKPLTVFHSAKDLDVVAEATARKLAFHGVTSEDVVQVTASYGLWQGAWSVHSGAERIGACVIPVGPGNTERQIRIIKQFNTTVLYGVTNFHFRIAEVARQFGEDLSSSFLRVGVCVAEKPTKTQVEILKKDFGYEVVASDYGATEFPGYSVHCCKDRDFHHVWADYHLVECVDPESLEAVGEGERGELVVTTLQREAFPLIRYRSNDVTSLLGFDVCECGMSHPKVGVDIDRVDYMTKVRGTPVFPSRFEFILGEFPELSGKNQLVLDKRTPRQFVTLRAELVEELPKATQDFLVGKIRLEVKNRVGISVDEVELLPFGSFEAKEKKIVIIE
jgi:phenylacetate-CoA ligase